MKRFRFSLRTLLIAIAVLCLLLGPARLWYVHATNMNAKAYEYEGQAQQYADTAWGLQRLPAPEPGSEQDKLAQRYWSLHHEHKKMADHYRRAAWRPFASEPKFDPPEGLLPRPHLDF